eukprot:1138356-Prymnesium_polylepis.1
MAYPTGLVCRDCRSVYGERADTVTRRDSTGAGCVGGRAGVDRRATTPALPRDAGEVSHATTERRYRAQSPHTAHAHGTYPPPGARDGPTPTDAPSTRPRWPRRPGAATPPRPRR